MKNTHDIDFMYRSLALRLDSLLTPPLIKKRFITMRRFTQMMDRFDRKLGSVK